MEVSLGHPSKNVQQTQADALFCNCAWAKDRDFRTISRQIVSETMEVDKLAQKTGQREKSRGTKQLPQVVNLSHKTH